MILLNANVCNTFIDVFHIVFSMTSGIDISGVESLANTQRELKQQCDAQFDDLIVPTDEAKKW